ncbi:MAG: hypothetical protein K0R92_1095 [Lachnospiraceae bacterium]|jgi:hypothetical protein|nr:hypothetical protein [Lachnospiraceae bacterium]
MNKSNEAVLLYNFDTEKLKKIKLVLIRMGIKIKIITKDLYLQSIGYLAGMKGFEKSEEIYKEEGFHDEMLVMKGFTSSRIDELLKLLKKNGVERIHLKAVLTEYNQNWNSIELYKELKDEHEQMTSNAAAIPDTSQEPE